VVGERDLDRVGQFSTIDDADAASTSVLSVEEVDQTRHLGLARVDWMFTLTATAYDLVQLSKLVGAVRSHGRTLLVSIAVLCAPPILGQLPRTGFNLH
jgi:hypothetical protein